MTIVAPVHSESQEKSRSANILKKAFELSHNVETNVEIMKIVICSCYPSRPTWGIASLRQTTDFTPGYIADRACREYELYIRPRWHDDGAYTMHNVVCRFMTVEARCAASARGSSPHSSIEMQAMYSAFALTKTAGYSACCCPILGETMDAPFG
jgi:hypothetical protein